ncbi:hypothetical protein ACJX0J_035526 [Zea mays]
MYYYYYNNMLSAYPAQIILDIFFPLAAAAGQEASCSTAIASTALLILSLLLSHVRAADLFASLLFQIFTNCSIIPENSNVIFLICDYCCVGILFLILANMISNSRSDLTDHLHFVLFRDWFFLFIAIDIMFTSLSFEKKIIHSGLNCHAICEYAGVLFSDKKVKMSRILPQQYM